MVDAALHGGFVETPLSPPPSAVRRTANTRGRPRQDSNLRARLRRPLLYPLSYGGRGPRGPEGKCFGGASVAVSEDAHEATVQRIERRARRRVDRART